jgi:hypothetical protein
MRVAYQPEALFGRYEHQVHVAYANRKKLPNSPQRASWRNIRRAMIMLARIFWFVGVKGDYKRVFWRFALARMRRGQIEFFIQVTLLAHHLILFAREASAGRRNASNYSAKRIEEDALVAAE